MQIVSLSKIFETDFFYHYACARAYCLRKFPVGVRMAFAWRYAESRSFAAKSFQAVENDRESLYSL